MNNPLRTEDEWVAFITVNMHKSKYMLVAELRKFIKPPYTEHDLMDLIDTTKQFIQEN